MANNNEVLNQQETLENQQDNHQINVSQIIGEYIENGLEGNLVFFEGVKNYLDHFHTYLLKSGRKQQSEQCKKQYLPEELTLELNQEIQAKTIPIYDALKKLKNTYFSRLSLDGDQSQKLVSSLHALNVSDLYHLIKSEKQRNLFIVRNGILTRDELDEKLDGITKSEEHILSKIFGNQTDIINKLKNHQDILESIFSIANASLSVDEGDIHRVLESGIFNAKQKKQLIEYFLPEVSLDFIERNNLIGSDDIDAFLEQIANQYQLSGIEKQSFLKKVNLSEIFVSTNTLNLSSFPQVLYEELAQEINDAKIQTVDIFGKDAFLLECRKNKLSLDFQKFREGNYFTIEFPKNEAGEKQKQYFYIKNIGSMSVEFVNVTKKNGISASVSDPQNLKGKHEVKTYQEFFNNLTALSQKSEFKAEFEEETDLKNQQGEAIDKIAEKDQLENVSHLKQALDEIDSKGTSVDIKKMGFSYKKPSGSRSPYDEDFFYVTQVKDKSIKLNSGQVFGEGSNDTLSDFLAIFEDNQCTRFEKLDTAGEFLEKMQSQNSLFDGMVYDHGKLLEKQFKGDHHAPGINLLVGDNQEIDGSIVINEIDDGSISFSFGEYKEPAKKGESGQFETKTSAENLSFTEFYMFIKNKKLKAKKQKYEPHHDDHDHHGPHMHEHGSLLTTWLSRFWSISELSSGAHQLIHAVEHSLETGNKLKSAKAALAMGRFLPTHIRVELQSQVEKSEKETMEKIKGEMLGVDWKDMWPMVEHVLENSSAPQYEVEAAMFAVMKYGSLYPKDLAPYRGQYIWFKKLGGHPSMIPILTQKALENDPNLVVTEEALINALLAMQAKGVPGYLPKRRSKIHKEFGKTLVEGVNNEMGDGEREAEVRMTADGRIDYLMQEFQGSTFAHGVGGMEKVWDKGPDPAWKMNTLPFVIMSTGISMNMHQKLVQKLKKYGNETPYSSLHFAASSSDVKLYQNYLKEVISLKYGNGSAIFKDYLAISGAKNSREAAYIFWKKYGEELYPIINMNDGYVIGKIKTGNDSKGILSSYYDRVKSLYNSADFSPKDADIGNEYYTVDNSPFAQTGALLYKIVPKDRGGFLDGVGKMVYHSHLDYITKVVNNPQLLDDEKKAIFKESYEIIERYIYDKMASAVGPKPGTNDWYKDIELYKIMKRKGFDVYNDQIRDPSNPSEVAKFNQGYDAFLESEWEKFKNKSHQDPNDILAEKKLVQHSIDTIMQTDFASNDDQLQQRA